MTVGNGARRRIGQKCVGSDVCDGACESSGQDGLLGASVDSEKVLGEGNVVGRAGGRHGVRWKMALCLGGGEVGVTMNSGG